MKKAINSKRAWSEEDKEYLKENYGVLAKKTLMKNLGRSARAIEHMAIQLFGTSKEVDIKGVFTLGQLAKFLGIDITTVNMWVKRLDLPATRINRITQKANMKYAYYYTIEDEAFWGWLKKNKDNICVNLKNVDLEVFGGIVPDWFKQDYDNKISYGTQKRWSKEEEKLLEQLFFDGKTATEIALELDRTVISVRKKIQRNNEKLKKFGIVS